MVTGRAMPFPPSTLPFRSGKPLTPVERLRSQVNRLFDEFGSRLASLRRPTRLSDIEPFRQIDALMGKFVPDADIAETDEAFTIRIELAGVKAQDVALELANDILTLRGEKRAAPGQREATRYLSRRRFGSFDRSFRLPHSVDRGKIEAKMDAGVLTILLPKTPEARRARRNIHIQGA